jgi:DNA-binding FadR family transcriptional regulator
MIKGLEAKSNSMGLVPIKTKQSDVLVLDALALFVSKTQMQVGDKLPAERELVDRLQVSRNTVREALKRWEALGIIQRRKGSGTFLKAQIQPGDSFLSLSIKNDSASMLHTLEIRRALEAEAGSFAARRATHQDLAYIEKCIDEVERVHNIYGGAGNEDWEFHSAIYRATHNPMFEHIIGGMYNAFHAFFEAPPEQDFADGSLSLHRDLFNAIKMKDSELARLLTHEILDVTERDIRRIANGK